MRPGALDGVIVPTGEVAPFAALDLDHPGAQIGEVAGGQRGGDGLLQGDDGVSLQRAHQRACAFAVLTNEPPMISFWISLVPSYRRSRRTSR